MSDLDRRIFDLAFTRCTDYAGMRDDHLEKRRRILQMEANRISDEQEYRRLVQIRNEHEAQVTT